MGDFCRFFRIRTIPRPALNLPPLSKVRCCRPKKFGRLPEGLLYTHQPLHPHNHCKMTIIPRLAPSPLPYERSVGFASLRNSGRSTSGIHARPLSKGGGLTARHKLSLSCVLFATRPPLYSLNFYAVKTEGLPQLHRPSPSPQPSQKHIHRLASHHPFAHHPSISHYSPSNIHFLPAYP